MKAAYYRKFGDFGLWWWEELYCTGRWKIESGPYYTNKLFIERKGLLWNVWVDEDDISFLPAKQTTVFECHGKDPSIPAP